MAEMMFRKVEETLGGEQVGPCGMNRLFPEIAGLPQLTKVGPENPFVLSTTVPPRFDKFSKTVLKISATDRNIPDKSLLFSTIKNFPLFPIVPLSISLSPLLIKPLDAIIVKYSPSSWQPGAPEISKYFAPPRTSFVRNSDIRRSFQQGRIFEASNLPTAKVSTQPGSQLKLTATV